MNVTNGRHRNDDLVDVMKKKMSKTEEFEKLTEIFRKQRSAGSKGNKNMDCQNFVLGILISIFQIFGSIGPVKQLIKLVFPKYLLSP